jgi:mono/diheme cytochrome c family protein
MNKRLFFLLSVVVPSLAIMMSGCSDKSQPNVELIQDMMESPAIKPQEAGMREPAKNTVPVGFTPYRWGTDLDAALKENKNPYSGQMTEDILRVGQKHYETSCMVCHGMHGEGGESTSVAQKMALKPPSLVSDKVKAMTDQHLFHIVTMGQGVMKGYNHHIPLKYRWQVVNYVRHFASSGEFAHKQ